MSTERMGGHGAVLDDELRRAEQVAAATGTVILVEGVSDQRALQALARRKGRDLVAEGVAIVPTAGVTNLARFLDILGPGGHDVALAGLCDEAERSEVGRALGNAGIVKGVADLETHGFFVCVRDLEDELVRSLGQETMVALIESQGDLRRFHSFQNQPAQRHKTIDSQLWRWLGNHKIRYASLMVGALDLSRIPHPLEGLLAHV